MAVLIERISKSAVIARSPTPRNDFDTVEKLALALRGNMLAKNSTAPVELRVAGDGSTVTITKTISARALDKDTLEKAPKIVEGLLSEYSRQMAEFLSKFGASVLPTEIALEARFEPAEHSREPRFIVEASILALM